MQKVLIRFFHGLGDHVQFGNVLRHLARHRPDWQITVRCGIGKHTALIGFCHQVSHDRETEPAGPWDMVIDIGFYENYGRAPKVPNTKVQNCLSEVFHLPYDADLETYQIIVPDDAKERAAAYFDSIGAKWRDDGRYNVFVLHYEGNTSQHRKNLHRHQAAAMCAFAKDMGLIPVILDWDNRSPLPDGKTIFNPAPLAPEQGKDLWGNIGTGDAATITALIAQAALYIGVDSGPGKCASATDTPHLICWRELHPIQFHDPCPVCTHLVPDNWESIPPCNDAPEVRKTFKNKYQFITYDTSHNGEHSLVEEALTWMQRTIAAPPELPKEKEALVYRWGFWLPKWHDLFCFWTIIESVLLEDEYKTRLRPKADGVEYVVDLGANIGAFSRLWHQRNPQAKIAAVEVNLRLVPALRENVGEYATVIDKACYYKGEYDVWLLDCLEASGSRNVGDSRLIDWQGLQRGFPQWYRQGPKVECLTLEQICKLAGFPRIDVLKLDIEGSEFNVLQKCFLGNIDTIFLESHDPDKMAELLDRRFQGWDVGHMRREGQYEILHLVSPNWRAP